MLGLRAGALDRFWRWSNDAGICTYRQNRNRAWTAAPESDSLPPYCGSRSAPEHGAPARKPNCSSVLIGTKRMFVLQTRRIHSPWSSYSVETRAGDLCLREGLIVESF